MNKEQIVSKTEEYVKSQLSGEGSGHDWWHVYRVWQSAKNIGEKEGADMFVVELTALLHDIADYKFHDGDDTVGPRVAGEWLKSLEVDQKVVDHVCQIIAKMSFKGAGVISEINTLEGMVVQDADRLDAMGAIGIARAFAYGGSKGREMYNPDIKPQIHTTFEQYKRDTGTSINHFYEKLLLLKDLMNTQTAREIANKRHEFMESYLEEFFGEWEGEK